MTQTLTIKCDICENQCTNEGMGNLQGMLVKMNAKLEQERNVFKVDLCAGCSEVMLNFVSKFKEDVQSKH